MLQAALVLRGFYQELAPELTKAHHLCYQTDLERMWLSRLPKLSQAHSTY